MAKMRGNDCIESYCTKSRDLSIVFMQHGKKICINELLCVYVYYDRSMLHICQNNLYFRIYVNVDLNINYVCVFLFELPVHSKLFIFVWDIHLSCFWIDQNGWIWKETAHLVFPARSLGDYMYNFVFLRIIEIIIGWSK